MSPHLMSNQLDHVGVVYGQVKGHLPLHCCFLLLRHLQENFFLQSLANAQTDERTEVQMSNEQYRTTTTTCCL